MIIKSRIFKAFSQTAEYDTAIAGHFRQRYSAGSSQMALRYGINPHQAPAEVYNPHGPLPFSGTTED